MRRRPRRSFGLIVVMPSHRNKPSIMRLIGIVLSEQNDESQASSRYMMAEAFAQIDKKEIDPVFSITTKAA